MVSCAPYSRTKGECKAILVNPEQSETLIFVDEYIRIEFAIGMAEIAFKMENKTDKAIKINWDEIIYISPNRESKRIIHSGVRYIDRNIAQAPSIVAPKTLKTDLIVPAENIYLEAGKYGRWKEIELFPGDDKSVYEGKEFSIYMPLQIGDKREEYTFTFRIIKIIVKSSSRDLRDYYGTGE
jgi:hypothetical protein